MKKMFATLAILVSISLASFAQPNGNGKGNRGECQDTEFCSKLNLTDEQKAQIKVLTMERIEKNKAIIDNAELSKEQKRTQRRALAIQHKESVRKILTAEQQKTLDEDRDQAQNRRYNNRQNKDISTKVDERLKLTDEQKVKAEALRQNRRTQLIALSNDSTIPSYDKLIKRREIALQHDKDLLNILTQTQKEEWGKMNSFQYKKYRSNKSKTRSEKLTSNVKPASNL